MSLDRWHGSRVVRKVEAEAEVAGPVGSEIQTRLEKIARTVGQNQAPHLKE